MSAEIRERLLAVIGEFAEDGTASDALRRGARIPDVLALDSMGYVRLVVRLESEFGVSIGFEEIDEAFADLDSLVRYFSAR